MKQKNTMDKTVVKLERFALYMAALFLAIVVLSSVIQVFSRTIIGRPLSWTEELARYGGIWMIMWAMGPIFRERGHIGVDFIYNKFPEASKRYVDVVNDVITTLTMIAFTAYSVILMINGAGTSAPAMRIPMSVIYAGMVLGGALSVFFAVYASIEHTKANFPKDKVAGKEGKV